MSSVASGAALCRPISQWLATSRRLGIVFRLRRVRIGCARCCANIVGILFSPRTGAIFSIMSNMKLNYSERSHSLTRGARGRISGNSKAGRYIRHRERELLEELAGEPTFLGRQYISDMARLECLKDQIETELHRDGHRDLPKLKAYRELVNALITCGATT
jgi:hypothetical protein